MEILAEAAADLFRWTAPNIAQTVVNLLSIMGIVWAFGKGVAKRLGTALGKKISEQVNETLTELNGKVDALASTVDKHIKDGHDG